MQVHVKAVPVNGLVQFVRSELSEDAVHKVEARMAADAQWFSGRLLADQVVPLEAVNRYTTFAASERGEELKLFARRAGRFGAEMGLKSVYRFILAVLSIDYVLRRAPFMWTRVYDGGKMDVDTSGERRARITVTEFPSDPAGCGRITGWFETIGERAGAKTLRCIHTQCMAEKGTSCVWDFQWDS